MTRIWAAGKGFVENDPYIIETDELKAEEGQVAVLPLDRFLAQVTESNEGNLAVYLTPADDVQVLAPYVDRLALVAVFFPAFNDGRGFSQSALLRERLGYTRDIRAIGDVLLDQIPHMFRCGFSSLTVSNPVAIARLEAGNLPGLSEHYQPSAKDSVAGQGYSWRRKALA